MTKLDHKILDYLNRRYKMMIFQSSLSETCNRPDDIRDLIRTSLNWVVGGINDYDLFYGLSWNDLAVDLHSIFGCSHPLDDLFHTWIRSSNNIVIETIGGEYVNINEYFK